MRTWHTRALACIALALALPALAKVPKDQADKLLEGGSLTPMGAEEAGARDGSILAWTGGWTLAPPTWKGTGTKATDPFPDDKPKFTITSANVGQYKNNLSPGQLALFARYPKSYKMNVYATRRTAGAPKFIYAATYNNALNAELGSNGEAVVNGITGIPFPIPQNGQEVMWNHKLRYRGQGGRRINVQAAVTETGSYNLSRLREDFRIAYSAPGIKPADLN